MRSPLSTLDPRAQELREAVAAKRAIVIAGAGVSMMATQGEPTASWIGLLLDGIERCRHLGELPESDAARIHQDVLSGDVPTMIAAAQELQNILSSVAGGHFGKWLRATIGSLSPVNPGILDAIAALDVPVATTNYDDLVSNAVGGSPCTWQEAPSIQRITRGHSRGVIYLHGKWDTPGSVVLGMDSYEAVVGDNASQQILRALFASNTVIFVGFGAGLNDPNFLGLRSWCRDVLRASDYPPTLLVRNDQVAESRANFESDGFQVLGYGDEYSDLELYLADLRAPGAPNEVPTDYSWNSLAVLLGRLQRRIRRDYDPQIVLSLAGPGSFAAQYCLSLDPIETPVLVAVTFPKGPPRSGSNEWFRTLAERDGWHHIESRKWDVYLPSLLGKLPDATRVLILDDRTIGGNVQRMVAQRLTDMGHTVRRAALIVHPDVAKDVDWYEEEIEHDFHFPWGTRRGRS